MKKRGFTLVEVIGTVAIVGILMAATAVSLNRVWQNNRIDIAESDLRDMTASLRSYMSDYGNITIAADDNYETTLNEVVNVLNRRYLSYGIEVKEIKANKKSACLETKIKDDPWGNKYKLSIYTYDGADSTSVPGLLVIASNGIDGISDSDTYTSGNYGDDCIAVVEPGT